MAFQWMRSLMSDAWRAVEAWRAKRSEIVTKQKPTYDAYPGDHPPPEVRFYVEARDVRGRLLREYVHLDGYSVNQLNWTPGATRGGVRITDWFAGRMLAALRRLTERVDAAKERREFTYPEAEKEKK